jgi:chromosomal replication initiation ATPase DnaA
MTVLEIYGITQEELVSDSRRWPIVEARQLEWLMQRSQGMTLMQIAERWNKTHPTVLSGINRITGLIKFDKRVRNAYYILSSGYNPCV